MTSDQTDRTVLYIELDQLPYAHTSRDEDKGVEHAVYIPPPEFACLSVQRYLEDLPFSTEAWFHRVSPKGRVEQLDEISGTAMRFLGPYGYIEVCLLSSMLFRDAPEDQVRDIRPRVPQQRRYRRCRDRPRLIAKLVDALLAYEAHGRGRVRADSINQSLEDLQAFVEGFVALSRQRRLTNKDLQAIRRRRILDTFALLKRLVHDTPPADYPKMPDGASPASSPYAMLLQQMDEAFLAYGPSRCPADAVDYAKAQLLTSLGVEANTALETIARRYRQDRHRARAS
jgi:hypothetical protein